MYFIVHKTAVIQMNYVTKYTQKLCRWDYSFSPFLKEIQSIIFQICFLDGSMVLSSMSVTVLFSVCIQTLKIVRVYQGLITFSSYVF